MSHRIPLEPNTKLCFYNSKGGVMVYTIIREIGRGGSCIVYEASFATNAGNNALYRIKECYPHYLGITRNADNSLAAAQNDKKKFYELQEKMCEDFSRTNSLFYSDNNYDNITNALDIYRANGTVYTASAFSSEKTLANYKPVSVKECVLLVKKAACILEKIHDCGYLYLDIKPDNVLVVDGFEKRVQLFDFDSLLPVSSIKEKRSGNIRLSYSRGFAPIELQLSQIKKLGFHSDIFEIGALLFYLLFGNTPRAADCENNAVFDFSRMRYDCSKCDDKLFSALTNFFGNTLANYYKDRYPNMKAVAEKLCEIERLADPAVPRIFSSKIIRHGNFVGRTAELCEIEKRLQESDCLFITGMGGIGKSVLVREFLARSNYDISLYMQFEGSIEKTVSSDENISISTLHQSDELHNKERYFTRKLRKIRELIRGKSSIITIDNFSGEIDDDFRAVLETEWNVIVVMRQAPAYANCEKLNISAISDRNALLDIFESNLNRKLSENEVRFFDSIAAKIGGHTLALELIAKQISSSHITLREADLLVTENGFTAIAPEQILHEKDNITASTTIGNIIDKLFDAACLSDEKKTLLKTASLLGVNGIDIKQFREIMRLNSFDDLNGLCRDGWLMINGDTLTMHPVIQEAVRRWDWSEEFLQSADKFFEYFYIEIRLLSTKNNYPKQLQEKCIRLKQSAKRNQILQKNGLAEKLLEERLKSFDDDSPADIKRLVSLVFQTEEILETCKREPIFKQRELYLNLLYLTILNMPLYREDYILARISEICTEKQDFVMSQSEEFLENNECKNPMTIMQIFAKAALIYQDRGRFKEAKNIISRARQFAKKVHHHRAYAVYYDMVSTYYDDLLDGHYDTEEPREILLRSRMLENIDLNAVWNK